MKNKNHKLHYTMNYENHKEERKEKWMKQNSSKSQLLGNNILPLHPELGFFITVEGLQISEDFFKEEYEQINKSYYSVMKKLKEYYKNNNNKNL